MKHFDMLLSLAAFLLVEVTYPPIDACRLLPCHEQCGVMRRIAIEHAGRLNDHILLRQWDNRIAEHKRETLWLYWTWGYAEDAVNTRRTDAERRMALRKLWRRMGWESELDMIEQPIPVPGM